MRLYAGTSTQFVQDTRRNQIAGKLQDAFIRQMGFKPGDGEVASWQNSLSRMADVVDVAGLDDHGVLLEYQLPLSAKRLDCMITGSGPDGPEAVIIELKQWSKAEHSIGEREVVTYVGGGLRDVLHPSVQVGQYRSYLADGHTAFHEGGITLTACAYLHNYVFTPSDVLLDDKFDGYLRENPVFGIDDVSRIVEFVQTRLSGGQGMDVLREVERGEYRPSKKLMEHVAGVIKGRPEYILLDEQLVVYDRVFAAAREGFHSRKKTTVIVKGGPGTGKSVVAINLMADLLDQEYNAHYATGSKAFTETLREAIGRRGAPQFKYFNSYMAAEPDAVDVLICDESHRIRDKSWNRFTPAAQRTDTPQVEELLGVGRVTVFFLDDDQVVRPNEAGSVEHIRSHAEALGHDVIELELESQFRCSGSDGFVSWVNNTLAVRRTANAIWTPGDEDFDFQILPTPEALEAAIRDKADEGHSARVTAGFCWPWSKKLEPGGLLHDDVVIGGYRRPWNAQHNATRLAPGIPKAYLWAYDPGGLDQIGCVYTAQGFEFDYVGVIFGLDLTYDLDQQEWVGDKSQSHDTVVKRSKDQFVDLVKNTYRVLLTRGMKGCYVHFMDKDTERFVKSRMAAAFDSHA